MNWTGWTVETPQRRPRPWLRERVRRVGWWLENFGIRLQHWARVPW